MFFVLGLEKAAVMAVAGTALQPVVRISGLAALHRCLIMIGWSEAEDSMLGLSKGFTREIIAFVFGMLLILVTFGDSHVVRSIGNLDTIFGVAYWKFLDVLYPFASIVVFLLYGKAKGGWRFGAVTIGLFLGFLVALFLISVDDVALVLHLSIILPKSYWIAIQWFYPVYSVVAFFLFGRANAAHESQGG